MGTRAKMSRGDFLPLHNQMSWADKIKSLSIEKEV